MSPDTSVAFGLREDVVRGIAGKPSRSAATGQPWRCQTPCRLRREDWRPPGEPRPRFVRVRCCRRARPAIRNRNIGPAADVDRPRDILECHGLVGSDCRWGNKGNLVRTVVGVLGQSQGGRRRPASLGKCTRTGEMSVLRSVRTSSISSSGTLCWEAAEGVPSVTSEPTGSV